MGRRPYTAAPIAAPAIIPSVSGVSRTRLSPYFAHRPSVAPKTPPFLPTSSPRTMTRSSRSISSSIARRIASRILSSAISVILPAERCERCRRAAPGDRFGVDALVGVVGHGVRARLRPLGRLVNLGLDVGPELLVARVGEHADRPELVGEQRDR